MTDIPVDGDLAVLLRAVQNHTVIAAQSLENSVKRHLQTDASFPAVFTYALDHGLTHQISEMEIFRSTGSERLPKCNRSPPPPAT